MRKWTMMLVAAALLLTVSPLAAKDVWMGPPDGWWMRGDQGTTWAHWDFQTMDTVSYPIDGLIPFESPTAELVGDWEWSDGWECPPELDDSGFVDGWHCYGPDGGTIVLHLPNFPDPNQIKMIFIQITSSKAPSDVNVVGNGSDPGGYVSGTWSTGVPHIQYPGPAPYGGVWYTYNYGLYIEPNPESEDIIIDVPYCTVVDQIVVDTICTDTTIPAAPGTWSGVKALFR